MVKDVYIKCEYSPSILDKKYIVKFNGSKNSYPPTGEVMVYEDELVKLDENSGLVKATFVDKRGKKTVVVVHDNEQGGVFSHVPDEEIAIVEDRK